MRQKAMIVLMLLFQMVFGLNCGAGVVPGFSTGKKAGPEVVFIDPDVRDAEIIVSQLSENAQVVHLRPNQEGLKQISRHLSHHTDLSAIHIISHGSPGRLLLCGKRIGPAELKAHGETLENWDRSLSPHGDILLYACNLARGSAGRQWVQTLVRITGAHVAASVDRTGRGGDWDLEYALGEIEADSFHVKAYPYQLATLVVTNYSDSGVGSLRAQIAAATAGDEITFADDCMIMLDSDLDVDKNLTITGNGMAATFIDGNNNSRVFNIVAGDVTLENMTIRNGDTNGEGGGIYINTTGAVTINSCTVNSNTSSGSGGGVLISGDSTVNINNSSISNNSTSSFGGGIAVWGTLNLTDTTVSGNSAVGAGGIYNTSNTVIENSTINSNTAEGSIYGGGGGVANSATLTLINSTISDNELTNNNGGGIYNVDGTMNIENCTVNGNIASSGYGGGIYNNATAAILNSTISANTTGDSEETANAYGGGIYHTGSSNVLTVVNSTIYYNDCASNVYSGGSERGGGIYVASGTVNTLNSIIIKNQLSVTGSDENIYNLGAVNSYYGWLNNNSGTSIGGSYNNGSFYAPSNLSSADYNGGFANTCAVSSAGNDSSRAGNGAYAYYNSTDVYYFESDGFYYKIAGQADPDDPTSFTPSSPSSDQITTDQRGYYRTTGAVTRGAFQYNGVFAKKASQSDWTSSSNTYHEWSTAVTGCINDTMILGPTAILSSGTTISNTVTIQGAGAGSTFVQADDTPGTASDRVFNITAGTVTLADMTIRYGNESSAGGIYNDATLSLLNCTVSENTADGDGGGIYNDDTLSLLNCTVSGNTSQYNKGGGIYNEGTITRLSNSTISGNTGVDSGGGIYNDGTITELSNSTISGNTAAGAGGWGGGILFASATTTMAVKNTIIANNTADTGPDYYFHSGTLTDNGYNIVQYSNVAANAAGGFNAATSILYNTKYNTASTDLSTWSQGSTDHGDWNLNLLSTLALNDSTNGTYTLALEEGSFAAASADTGIPYGSSPYWNDSTATDQRGVSRMAGQNTSIGAYSANYTPPIYYYKSDADGGNWNVSSGDYTWTRCLTVDGTYENTYETPTTTNAHSVTIVDCAAVTITSSDAVTMNNLTVDSGGSLVLNTGGSLEIADGSEATDFAVNGTFDMYGGTFTLTSGVLAYGAASTLIYSDSGASQTTGSELLSSVNNLTLDNSNGVTVSSATSISGTLNVTSGTQLATSQNITVSGTTSGTGSVNAAAGTFNYSRNGDQAVFAGVYNNLEKSQPTTACTLTFPAGSTTTVAGALTLRGQSGKLLSLRSSAPGTQWNINPTNRTVEYLDVQDSRNTHETAIDAGINSVDSGNNTNWTFPGAPTVTTQAVSNIGVTTATGNGNITALGTDNPSQYGVCWSTSVNPTTADSKTTQGEKTETGAFISSITDLSASTAYYVRAYATNSYGTSYGDQVSFTTYSENVASTNDGGNWSETTTWSGGKTPVPGQNVTIAGNVILDTSPDIQNLTVNSGKSLTIADSKTLTVNGELRAAGSIITFTGAGTLDLAGTVACDAFGTFNCDTGTVIYSADADQNVDNLTYYNLTLSGNGIKTLCGDATVAADLTVSDNDTTIATGAYTVSVERASDMNGILSIATGTYDANGAFDAAGGSVTFTGAGVLRLAGTIESLGTFTKGTGWVVYDGGDQSVKNTSSDGIEYYAMDLGGTGTKTFSGTTTATGGIGINGSITVTGSTSDASDTIVQAAATSETATNRVFLITSNSTLENMTIRNGKADKGGGISIYGTDGFTVNISNVAVIGNVATTSDGGGIYVFNNDVPFEADIALNISNSTIADNTTASNGGGIFIDFEQDNYSQVNISNSTISGNSADSNGGGIYANSYEDYYAELTISNSTIANNHSDNNNEGGEKGGGIYLSAEYEMTVKNTIIANNFRGSETTVGDDYYYGGGGTLMDNGYNVVKYQSGAVTGVNKTFTAPTNFIYTGSGNDWDHNGDTVIGMLYLSSMLADNGGPTQTLAITFPLSIAVDNGYYDASVTTTDQRGATRHNSGQTIGAYEVYSIYATNGAGTEWGTAANWNMYNGVTSPVAAVAPNADNSTSITLNHDMTVDADVTIDQTTVSADKTLTVAGGQTLTVANGEGTDLGANGNLAVNASGTLLINSGAGVDSNGSFTSSGTISFDAASVADDGTLTLAAAAPAFGSLTPGNGTVTLDGTSQALSESQTYYNLTKTVSAADTLTFEANSTTTVTGILTLTGQSGALLSLLSSSPETQWQINPTGTRTISYVAVQDSNNINDTAIDASNGCENLGRNTNWSFARAPTVTTQAVTNIAITTATGNGTITDPGTESVTQHGVCWNTTGSPTTSDPHTSDGASEIGAFESSMTGLSADTLYYVRAYAGNSDGTGYGDPVTFPTRPTSTQSTSDGSWSEGGTWADGLVPISGQNVTINSNVTLDANVETNGLTLGSGKTLTFNDGKTLTVNGAFDGSAGTITFSGTGALNLAGTVGCSAFGTFTRGQSTVNYSGGNQSVDDIDYYHLTLSVSGIKTLCGDLTGDHDIDGSLTIGSGVTLDVDNSNSYGIEIAGNWSNSGTFTARAGTVTFNGSGNASLASGGSFFYGLILNKAGGDVTTTLSPSEDLTVSNALTVTMGTFDLDTSQKDLHLGGVLNIGANGRWTKSSKSDEPLNKVAFYGEACLFNDAAGSQDLGNVLVEGD